MGNAFDGVNFSPVPAIVPAAPRIITKWELRQRFSFTERVAITASTDPGVLVIREDMIAAMDINLDDPSVGLSVDYIISKGLLKPDRKAAILA